MSARIIADSVSPEGVRLTTFEITMHRFVLAEFNTHRVISRNSASSRAIPLKRTVERTSVEPAYPVSWPREQSGMQGGDELEGLSRERAEAVWDIARRDATRAALDLGNLGVHKSVANRLLEPFMWHTVIATATAWQNFFDQRDSKLAQPEIRAVAAEMHDLYRENDPMPIGYGEYHLPYITPEDENDSIAYDYDHRLSTERLIKVSVARCARVSYLTHDGKRDLEKDLALYDRLVSADPPHWSPLEHVARPDGSNMRTERFYRGPTVFSVSLPVVGNFYGWRQHRFEVEMERGIQTYR